MLQTSAEREVKASNSSPESRRVCEKLILQTVPSFPAPPQLLFTIYWCFFSCSTSCYCCSVAKNSLNINSRMGDTCRTSRGTRDPRVKRSSSALFQQREAVWFIGDRFLKALCSVKGQLGELSLKECSLLTGSNLNCLPKPAGAVLLCLENAFNSHWRLSLLLFS